MRPCSSLLGLLSILILGAGCHCNSQVDWVTETQRVESIYTFSNINAAESALLGYVHDLERSDPHNVRGIDYDFCLGLAHGRLFLIYDQKLDKPDRDAHFEKSIEILNRRRIREGSVRTNYTPDTLTKYIEAADSTTPVRWKSDSK
jgi:hypothetical protein